MSRNPSRRTGVRWALVAPLVAVGMVVAGCGGSSSSSNSTGSTSAPASTSSTATTSSGGGAGQLKAFGGTIESAKNATFKAVYSTTSSDGGTQTITLAQSPPKQVFSTTDSSGTVSTMVNTGTATYSCETSPGGTPTCTSMSSSAGAGALSALVGVYNGSTALSAINGWQSVVAAHVTGASLSFTRTTIAGQAVRCANWAYQGSSATYCVTNSGVLAKVSTSGGAGSSATSSNFELTDFSASPPASEFDVPAGATVVTVP